MKGSNQIHGAACRYWMVLRGKRGVDLARAAGATEAFVSRALNGRTGVSDAVLAAIARELDVSVDCLQNGTAERRIAAVAS